MRVLHVTDHYLPVLGGIETHVSALAERQARRGDEVAVLTSTPATADGRHDDDAGEVQVRRDTLPAALAVDLSAYDVVHAHVSVVAPFTAPLVARAARSGVPVVVTVHSLWNGLGPLPGLVARLTGLRGAPVRWTAVSDVAARELARRLPPGTDVALLPNAVDVAARPRTPAADRARPVRVVSTMRIARRKRPLALLQVFEAAGRSAERPLTLTVVGDGPLRPALERRARRAGLADAVRVTGRLEPAEVLAELRAADVYVAPALLESFGLAALEARCTGLPVVGHAGTGMVEFVRHGVEGMLCRDDADLASALRRLVTDDDLRHRISEHNRTTRTTMTWANALDRVDEVYDALTGPLVRRGVDARKPVPR
jgi:glycosyltransferase involved in cell wall biosynthesis